MANVYVDVNLHATYQNLHRHFDHKLRIS